MLNYAPDGMAGGTTHEWPSTWACASLPDEHILLRFIAATKKTAAFEPERVSGFCAG